MSTNNSIPNQAIFRRVFIETVCFVGKPTPQEIQHLKATGFTFARGQWERSSFESGINPSEMVFEIDYVLDAARAA
jgi:hypothetical protein